MRHAGISHDGQVEEGVVVFGTLWARERGHVVASQ